MALAQDVKPIAETDRYMYHHLGYTVGGRLHVVLEDGTEDEIGPQEMFEIPPGHDAWVVGDEPWEAIDFRGARSYARPPMASGDRILAFRIARSPRAEGPAGRARAVRTGPANQRAGSGDC